MKMSAEVNEVFEAFSLFQEKIEDVKRDSNSLKGKYAKLEQILQSGRKLLSANGLAVTQLIGDCSGEYVEIENIILHKSGQFFSTNMKLAVGKIPLNSQGRETVNMAQFVGLNISYARRYGLLAILGMAQEDEDAEMPQQKAYRSNMPKVDYVPAAPKQSVPKQEIPHVSEIDVRKLAIEQIDKLIEQHNISVDKTDKIKDYYGVKNFDELNESQAKSVVNKIKVSVESVRVL